MLAAGAAVAGFELDSAEDATTGGDAVAAGADSCGGETEVAGIDGTASKVEDTTGGLELVATVTLEATP